MTESAPILPSWRYHVSGTARIVHTPEDLAALPEGEWFESPEAAADAATRTAAQAQSEGSSGPAPPRSRR